jgi:small GTP-binding protein
MSTFKVCFLGSASVGKTSIIKAYAKGEFDPHAAPTVGDSLVERSAYRGAQAIQLRIWDTAGTEKFQALTSNYCRDASVIVFVFDLTETNTFADLGRWKTMADKQNECYLPYLVGNKTDLQDRQTIRQKDIHELREAWQAAGYFETSAKHKTHIDDLFEDIANHEALTAHEVVQRSVMPEIQVEPETDRSSCCVNTPSDYM